MAPNSLQATIPIQTDADANDVAAYKQSGDLAVLGTLYNRYMGMVYGVCLKYLENKEDAQDAVSNIFEELVEKVKKYEIANFRPWLHTVAKNHCLMQLRSKKLPAKELTDGVMSFEENVHLDNVMEKEANLNRMEDCIEQLGAEQKTAIKLFYLEEKCYQEIAEITTTELGKVRSQIQNGRRNLKICMEQNSE